MTHTIILKLVLQVEPHTAHPSLTSWHLLIAPISPVSVQLLVSVL